MGVRAVSFAFGLAFVGLITLAGAVQDDFGLIERGRYLATVVGGCKSCHTPHRDGSPIPGREFSGHPAQEPGPVWKAEFLEQGVSMVTSTSRTAFAGPWGASFASNLTKEDETGLGTWNENMFIRTMRRGEFHPPMPVHLKSMTRSDLRAIWHYLQTLPPVSNRVPDFEDPH